MRRLDKKGAGLEMESLVKIILLVVFLVIAAILIVSFFTAASTSKTKVYGCWISNGIMASNAITRGAMSVPCKQEIIENPLSKDELAVYLKDVWFMFGKGKWDFHITSDDWIIVTAFKMKEDVTLKDLYLHLMTHKGARSLVEGGTLDLKDLASSDYNYLQSGSPGQTVCFHEDLKPKDGIAGLAKGKVYYILFWDDTARGSSTGDKIIITTKPEVVVNAIGCCTLQTGQCVTLNGDKWYDYTNAIGNLVVGYGWAKPGAPTITPGKMF